MAAADVASLIFSEDVFGAVDAKFEEAAFEVVCF